MLTPLPETRAGWSDRAQAVWQAVGSRVVPMSAQAHDQTFAAVSHLPHLLAFAYVNGVAAQPKADDFLGLAGPGFRDFSRIAASDPQVWRDILLANRAEVTAQARHFRESLAALETLLEAGDADGLEAAIRRARDVRAPWRLGGA